MLVAASRKLLVFCVALPVLAQAPRYAHMERLLNQLRQSPPELYAFLFRMPKGGDLHSHVGGASYAENIIAGAAKAGYCFDTHAIALVRPAPQGGCSAPGLEEAGVLAKSNAQLSTAVDSFSMRDYVPGHDSPHDHFFNTFPRMPVVDHAAALAELTSRAADQNESYLELMALSGVGPISDLGKQIGLNEDNFQDTADKLQPGLATLVADMRQKTGELEANRRAALKCDQSPDSAPCKVVVRYVFQVLRESSKEQVFAQMLAGFQLAASDPRIVAVNFVQAEDGVNSMADYRLHMRMVAWARRLYPKVHVTLHAGELASGLVPPEGLRFHIREAVEVAGAERIGHGVDIMYETDSLKLLNEMRARHVAVEINLTSNDLILGVKGKDHPFPVYRKYNVPVVLSTDDEAVNRSHLTQEYQRAVLTYGLTYADLKEIVRNSLEYSFLSGPSYWSDAHYRSPVKACAAGLKSKACSAFLAESDKARAQADLEERFRAFEAAN